jgi:hypothetical protein
MPALTIDWTHELAWLLDLTVLLLALAAAAIAIEAVWTSSRSSPSGADQRPARILEFPARGASRA